MKALFTIMDKQNHTKNSLQEVSKEVLELDGQLIWSTVLSKKSKLITIYDIEREEYLISLMIPISPNDKYMHHFTS